jgi:hypothetical protein
MESMIPVAPGRRRPVSLVRQLDGARRWVVLIDIGKDNQKAAICSTTAR